MAQLTLNIPEALAERLQPLQHQLPELLWQILEIHEYSESTLPTAIHYPSSVKLGKHLS